MPLVIVDSKRYARSNCFVGQLIEAMDKTSRENDQKIQMIELDQLENFGSLRLAKLSKDGALLICRQRILNRFFDKNQGLKMFRDIPISIYEQDPWHSYIVDSESLGFFGKIKSRMNIQNIFLTSEWWSKFVAKQENINTVFVHMWMLPRYCKQGASLNKRDRKIAFRGALHPHRKVFFKEMESLGIEIEINSKRLEYKKYLKWLSSIGIYIHDESGYFRTIAGDIPMSTALWAKDIEIASRGTFVVRNRFENESSTYLIDKIPLINLFDKFEDVPDLINSIVEKSEKDLKIIAHESVSFIEKADLWSRTAELLMRNN